MELLLASILATLPSLASAEVLSQNALEKAHAQSISTVEGRSYEMKAVSIFWGDTAFMQVCAPKDGPVPENIDIYFLIMPDGKIGEVYTFPTTQTAECIKSNVSDRIFANAPANYVAHIELKFTP